MPVVFNGHEHLYQRTLPVRDGIIAEDGQGTVYVTSGGGGAGLYPYCAHPFSVHGVSAHHFLKCRIEGERLTVVAVGIDGVELDRFEVAPKPAISQIETQRIKRLAGSGQPGAGARRPPRNGSIRPFVPGWASREGAGHATGPD